MKFYLKILSVSVFPLFVSKVVASRDLYKSFDSRRWEYRKLKLQADKNFVQEIGNKDKWIKLEVKDADRVLFSFSKLLPNFGKQRILSFDTVFTDPYFSLVSSSERRTESYTGVIDPDHIRKRVKKAEHPDLMFWYSLFDRKEILPILSRYEVRYPETRQIQVPYYGKDIFIIYNGIFPSSVDNLGPKKNVYRIISNFILNVASNSSINSLIEQVNLYSQLLGLNDWAKYKLFEKSIAQIYSDEESFSRKILLGYVLMVSGYDVKYAYGGKKLQILLPINKKVYDLDYVELAGRKHYITESLKSSKLEVLDYSYRKDNRVLDVSNPLPFLTLEEPRIFTFIWNNKPLEIPYNETYSKFYEEYLNLGIQVKLYTPFSLLVKHYLKQRLKPFLDALENDQKRIDYLLKLTQTIFEPDKDGSSNFVFAEQLFTKTHISTESRVAFFIQLVRSLLDVPILAFTYLNYILVGIHLPDLHMEGFKIKYKGKDYMVCDPNRITNIGLILGDFKMNTAK